MAPPLSYNDWLKYNNVLDAFQASGISVASFIRDIVLFSGEFEAKHADLIKEVLDNARSILIAFAQHAYTAHASGSWATSFAREIIKRELIELTDVSMGLHFNASHAKAGQITNFTSGPLVARISDCAPNLWSFMQEILRLESSSIFTGNEKAIAKKKKVFDLVCNVGLINRLEITKI